MVVIVYGVFRESDIFILISSRSRYEEWSLGRKKASLMPIGRLGGQRNADLESVADFSPEAAVFLVYEHRRLMTNRRQRRGMGLVA